MHVLVHLLGFPGCRSALDRVAAAPPGPRSATRRRPCPVRRCLLTLTPPPIVAIIVAIIIIVIIFIIQRSWGLVRCAGV
eukprot:7783378-Pyramimonas_sp.AAC.1